LQGGKGEKKVIRISSKDGVNYGSGPDYQIYLLFGWSP
jgi:hypothetical protein